MRHHLVILAVGALLLGCDSGDPALRGAENPYHGCHAQGIPYGSEDLQACVEESIAAQCAAAGHEAETPGYEGCARRLRDMVLVTRDLELWGYRTLDQRPFN